MRIHRLHTQSVIKSGMNISCDAVCRWPFEVWSARRDDVTEISPQIFTKPLWNSSKEPCVNGSLENGLHAHLSPARQWESKVCALAGVGEKPEKKTTLGINCTRCQTISINLVLLELHGILDVVHSSGYKNNYSPHFSVRHGIFAAGGLADEPHFKNACGFQKCAALSAKREK